MPKLVFVNTEKKLNTKNDDKAFAVARWVRCLFKRPTGLISISTRRNSSYTKSGHSVLDNIYIFEVTHRLVYIYVVIISKYSKILVYLYLAKIVSFIMLFISQKCPLFCLPHFPH